MVEPSTIANIVRHESKFATYAININGDKQLQRQPKNRAEAIATAQWLLENNYNFDVGLAQINSRNLVKFNVLVSDAFEPCTNIELAGKILHSSYVAALKQSDSEQEALRKALSAYNTGNFSLGFKNGYVANLVASVNVPLPKTANDGAPK
jgi:type IV secretion system protein VirB1